MASWGGLISGVQAREFTVNGDELVTLVHTLASFGTHWKIEERCSDQDTHSGHD